MADETRSLRPADLQADKDAFAAIKRMEESFLCLFAPLRGYLWGI